MWHLTKNRRDNWIAVKWKHLPVLLYFAIRFFHSRFLFKSILVYLFFQIGSGSLAYTRSLMMCDNFTKKKKRFAYGIDGLSAISLFWFIQVQLMKTFEFVCA